MPITRSKSRPEKDPIPQPAAQTPKSSTAIRPKPKILSNPTKDIPATPENSRHASERGPPHDTLSPVHHPSSPQNNDVLSPEVPIPVASTSPLSQQQNVMPGGGGGSEVAPKPKKGHVLTKIKLKRSPNLRQVKRSFKGLVNWKNQHSDIPFTSTPIPASKKVYSASRRDVQTCFGFDDDSSKDASSFISPIPYEKKPTRFPQPTASAPRGLGKVEKAILPPPLPIDENQQEVMKVEKTEPTKKRKKRTNKVKEEEEMKEWIAETQKEFQDIENFPLVVEQPSNPRK